MAHYYYCPFSNVTDQAIKNTEYRYAVKYGDPSYAHYDPSVYRSKEAGRTDSVVIRTNVVWKMTTANGVTKRRPSYIVPDKYPLAKMALTDTLIIDGHGGQGMESLYAADTSAAESLAANELAVQLAMDGLKRGHVFIKFAACYSGGAFDGDEHKVLARKLAIALGGMRWNPEKHKHDTSMTTGAYRKIKVGGFQGKLHVYLETWKTQKGTVVGYKPKPSEVEGKSGQKAPAKHKLIYFDADGNMVQKVPLKTETLPNLNSSFLPPKQPVKKPPAKQPVNIPTVQQTHTPPTPTKAPTRRRGAGVAERMRQLGIQD